MERSTKSRHLSVRIALAALCVAACCRAASAQGAPEKSETPPPEPPAVARECGESSLSANPLPNSAQALQKGGKIRILAIGASSAAMLGVGRDGNPPLLEQILEKNVKGLDVEIINRGFSGELAEAAGARLKIEVALNRPDLALWQVGTNDAFAHVPVEEFERTVGDTIRWLKDHNVDVILIGLHYMKQLAKNEHYQAIRASLRRITAAENVMRITRYEAMEVLSRTMRENGRPEPGDFGASEAGYNCMAQYVARAIAVGLFAKPKLPVPKR
jgi:hypothetical protein